MEMLNIKEYNLDYVMENYFNTDKEIMFMCDYKTALEILAYSEYNKEDFNEYKININNKSYHYYIYKNDYNEFIVDSLLNNNEDLYSIYEASNIIIQDCVLKQYGQTLIERLSDYDNITAIGDLDDKDLSILKSLDDCKECDYCNKCCEEEKDNKHYNRMKGVLKYDIEERDIQEQKEILDATIQVANELKEELEISNEDGYYDIWNSIIENELEMLDGDVKNEKKLLEQIQKVVMDQLQMLK